MAVSTISVNRHTQLKQPQKRYICSFCARTFSRSEHKLRHERSHTKEKPFDCKICSSAFVRRDLLQRHCRTVHGVVMKSNNQQLAVNNQNNETSNVESHEQDQEQLQLLQQPENYISPKSQYRQQEEQRVEQNLSPVSTLSSRSHSLKENNIASTLSEKNIISILTLCKKFNYLTIPYELENAICNYFLTYGTRVHNILPLIKFDRILNLNENDESLFIILCIGANENNDLLDSIKLFNKSWSIINDKINSHMIDYNSENIDEFVENVIMLSYIYLNYFDNYFDQDVLSQNITVEIDVLFEYLVSVIVTQILNEGRNMNNGISFTVEELLQRQFPVKLNYWHAHVLLLQYCFTYNKPPSILHSFLLNKQLPIEDGIDYNLTLSQLLKNLTVSSSLYNRFDQLDMGGKKLFKKLGLIDNIIINSLLNELLIIKQKYTPNNVSYPTATSTFFDDNKNFLHNSIILANKSFNYNNEDDENSLPHGSMPQQQHHNQYNMNQPIGLLNDGVDNLTVFSTNGHLGNWTVSNKNINNLPYIQFLNMLILCKRKMLINCPLKFIDLISNYAFVPKDLSNWALLNITLKEFNNENKSGKFDKNEEVRYQSFELDKFIDLSNLSRNSLSVDQISDNINTYINSLFPRPFVINNNLGIVVLPVLYLSLNNVNNTLVNHKNFLSLPSNKHMIVGFIVEVFLTMIRVLVNYRHRLFSINMHKPAPYNEHNSYNKNDMLITSPEGFLENSILSVILYFMDQCGSNVLSKLPPRNIPKSPDSMRPRSNSISIGEFNHNSELLKHSLLDKFDDEPKNSPEYPPLVRILSNDFKYYYYLKNLENALVNWLNVFIIDPSIIASGNIEHLMRYRNFISGLQKSLNKIYEKLDLSTEPQPVATKISSPDLRPIHNINDVDFQQQQLQQQSFTSLMNSDRKNHALLSLQQRQRHQQLDSKGFNLDSGIATTLQQGSNQQVPPLHHHQRIILPPIVSMPQQSQQQSTSLPPTDSTYPNPTVNFGQ